MYENMVIYRPDWWMVWEWNRYFIGKAFLYHGTSPEDAYGRVWDNKGLPLSANDYLFMH